jgi:hypothetical protein
MEFNEILEDLGIDKESLNLPDLIPDAAEPQ